MPTGPSISSGFHEHKQAMELTEGIALVFCKGKGRLIIFKYTINIVSTFFYEECKIFFRLFSPASWDQEFSQQMREAVSVCPHFQ
mmetsp:Transcript_12529/g.20446  ORF Transcript_12529/g.20446 Transcript_12529/m.20446 type:complete len:85 (+) Transcript_12529:354-608(+)